MSAFSPIADVLEDIKSGKLIILVDDPDRENEGDFFIPAVCVTPETVNFMLLHGRGLLCVALDMQQAQRLGLSPMVPLHQNTESTKVNFAVSVNAKHGITSGISAFDRAQTIAVLARPDSRPEDITKPGHVFPLIADPGGLIARQGHTEAAVSLVALGGYPPAGVVCEILNDDGTMAKLPDLINIAQKFDLKIASIADLKAYIKSHPIIMSAQSSVVETATAQLPTTHGTFDIHVFRSIYDGFEHSALVFGNVGSVPVLTRVHSQCLTGDTLTSLRCDCNAQLHQSMELIKANGSGVILYLNQEGRGIGLSNKIKAYALQDQGYDTVEANHLLGLPTDARNYTVAADMLRDLGIGSIDLLTNNPEKEVQLRNLGVQIHAIVPLETLPNQANIDYLKTKKLKLGHRFTSI